MRVYFGELVILVATEWDNQATFHVFIKKKTQKTQTFGCILRFYTDSWLI